MESLQCTVVSNKGDKGGKVSLNPAVFGLSVHSGVVHEVVRWQRASQRSGTHATLRKGEMDWGKKKPWKQKGTGRARAGSATSPLWVGGGVSHGPQPRDYSYRISKRTRQQALCAVLSDKVKRGEFLVIDKIDDSSAKTRDVVAMLNKIGVAANSAVILIEGATQFVRATRNIPGVRTLSLSGLNVYELLKHKFLVVPLDLVSKIEARLLSEVEAEQATASNKPKRGKQK